MIAPCWGRLAVLSLSACVLSDVGLEGRACPCLDGWVCRSEVCVPSSDVEPASISAPQQLTLTRGRSQSLQVELTGAPCVVSFVDLPPGVSTTPQRVALSRGNPSQTFVISASDDARLGDAAAAFDLRPEERPDSPSQVPLRVTVRGRPGTLDPSFGDAGIASLGPAQVPALTPLVPNARVAQRRDGSLVVAWSTSNATPVCHLARLDRNGKRDDSFAPHAAVFDDPAGCTVRAMTVAPDDAILIATTPPVPYNSPPVVVPIAITRVSGNSVDATFGQDGTLVSAARTYELETALIDQRLATTALGQIVVSGSPSTNDDMLDVARYDSAGHLDPSFADGGLLRLNYAWTYGTSMLQPDGHVLIPVRSLDEFGLLRLDSSGATDAQFGDGGVLTVPRVQGLTLERVGVAPDDGQIVIASSQIFRFNHDGVDAGTTRVSPTELIASDIAFARGQAHFVLQNGGSSLGRPTAATFFLARLTPEGAPDEELGPGGRVEIAQEGYHRGMSLVVQDDGAWVVATRLVASALGHDGAAEPELVVERFFR